VSRGRHRINEALQEAHPADGRRGRCRVLDVDLRQDAVDPFLRPVRRLTMKERPTGTVSPDGNLSYVQSGYPVSDFPSDVYTC